MMIDLEAIKARLDRDWRARSLVSASHVDDVDAIAQEVERLRGRIDAYKVAFRRLGTRIRAEEKVRGVLLTTGADEVRVAVLMPNWLQRIIGAEMALILEENKAVNYVDFTCGLRGKEYILTVQRKEGRTPHELRREAEAEVERLRAERQHLVDENAQMRAILVQVGSDYTRRVGKDARALLGKE